MTKKEALKCSGAVIEAIKEYKESEKLYKKGETLEKEGCTLESEISIRRADQKYGYALGINQALNIIGFKHPALKELGKMI